jgi:hypothetical protein
MRTDGQANRHAKANIFFRNFAKEFKSLHENKMFYFLDCIVDLDKEGSKILKLVKNTNLLRHSSCIRLLAPLQLTTN